VIWVYERAQDEVRCEVRPTPGNGCDVILSHGADSKVVHTPDVMTALQRQLAVERRLLATGWTLKGFYRSKVGVSP
jgi:hypothetical protein